MDLKAELEAVVDALQRDGVSFGLCGGIAVSGGSRSLKAVSS